MRLFSRKRKPHPPYDGLPVEQRYALYYMLEYIANGVPYNEARYAINYLEKASIYYGMTNKQIEEFRSYYDTFDKISNYIRQIKDCQVLEYLISNSDNLFVLMYNSGNREILMKQTYSLYYELGFSFAEIQRIIRKYRYRIEI